MPRECPFCAADGTDATDLHQRHRFAVECVPCGAIAHRRSETEWTWSGPATRARGRKAFDADRHAVELGGW